MATRARLYATTVAVTVAICIAAGGRPAAQGRDADVIAKLRAWIDAYSEQLQSIVAEERYVQKVIQSRRNVRGGTSETTQTRVLESEFLLVKPNQDTRWIPLRDVMRVDGQALGDRAGRLEKLLLDASTASFDAAARIANESSRYNIGGVIRTVNVPTLALAFIQTRNASCCRLHVEGPDQVQGERFTRVSFDETEPPGLVASEGNKRVKSKGDVWVRADGSLRRSRLLMTVGNTKAEIQVDWRHYPGVDIIVPVEMQETYTYGGYVIEGLAVYSHIRKFTVTTEETIKK